MNGQEMGSGCSVVLAVEGLTPPVQLPQCGLTIEHLGAGDEVAIDTVEQELVIVSLGGSAEVTTRGRSLRLEGRKSVFTGISDIIHLPATPSSETVTLSSRQGGRFAVARARVDQPKGLPPRRRDATEVDVELRGSGVCSRQVNNLLSADIEPAESIIVVEVLTPGGNWSSYPPHKHDTHRPGSESDLEEIYYFEIADGPKSPGLGYQRVYADDPTRAPIDMFTEVRTGDVVTIPYGWHGPSMALPGYDMYYLNVMAGPHSSRTWEFSDDPAHAWVRKTWDKEEIDPRLPFEQKRIDPTSQAKGGPDA